MAVPPLPQKKVEVCFNFSPAQPRFPWSGTINWGDGSPIQNVSIPNNGCFEHYYPDLPSGNEYEIVVDISNECTGYFIKGTVINNSVVWGEPVIPSQTPDGGHTHGSGCTCGGHH